MVNIYILTSTDSVYDKLRAELSETSYMEVASYQLDNIDDLIKRIDKHQDVDVALISEDIVNEVSYNMIDREIVKSRNVPYLIINTSKSDKRSGCGCSIFLIRSISNILRTSRGSIFI